MGARERYREELRAVAPADRPAYLTDRSGLPGPRGNIELGQAAADEGDRAQFDAWSGTGDEYLTFCAALGYGRLLARGERDAEPSLRAWAADERWRVREGVATGLQRLGDADLDALIGLTDDWARDRDPRVQRAAVAALCEPRLLVAPRAAGAAVELCSRLTRDLVSRPRDERAGKGGRALRQALGYCWSVAVAADPDRGLPVFLALDTADTDVAWIVRENSRKKRLAALL